jgi:hypothetical protein
MLGCSWGSVPYLPDIFVRTNESGQCKRVGATEPERPTQSVGNPTEDMTLVDVTVPAWTAAKDDERMTTLS